MFNFFRPGHHTAAGRYPAGWGAYHRSRNKPRQGEREIARRLRQAERDEQRQRERASMVTAVPAERQPARVSRRWRWMA